MLTEAVIRRLAPRARDDYVKALTEGDAIFEEYEINTPLRMAAFLATALHETGCLTITRENMNYSAQRLIAVFPKRYAGNPSLAAAHAHNPKLVANFNYGFRLGNEDNGAADDDGWLFRGGGLFQTTGKANFRRMGKLAGVDLVAKPELIDDPMVSLEAACAEAAQFHKYADRGEKGFFGYSNGINRGDANAKAAPIGWDDRLKQYRRVIALLPQDEVPVDDDILEVGDHGALVEGLQKRLTELGYPVGAVNGVFGPYTEMAVMAFQAQNGLEKDGKVGRLTRAALNKSDAKPMPVSLDRVKATEEDLAKAGSGTILDARAVETATKAVTVGAVIKGAEEQLGVLETLRGWVGDITAIRAVVDPAIALVKWSLGFWWLFAIVAGIYVLQKSDAIKKARLAAHRLGQHLGR